MTRARTLSKVGSSPAVFSDGAVVSGITTIDASGLNITGVATATSFSGDGSSLSGVGVPGVSTTGHSVFNTIKASGITTISATTSSTSTTTGALIVTGGVGIGKSLFVGEGISVGGTITYDDVTNIDSIGIVTAGKGFRATTGGLIVTAGVSTFTADISIADKIIHTGDTNTAIRFPANDTFTVETSGSERLRITSNAGLLLSNGILVEHCKIVSTAWSTTNDISLDDGNVFLNTANLAGTNNTIDITSSNGLNVDLAVGDMTSVTLITAVNATTAFINHITIAASAVTESWVGGSAPTAGGGSGYDVYTFNIIKTAANTYVCIANQVKGS